MLDSTIGDFASKVIQGQPIQREQALHLAGVTDALMPDVLFAAGKIRDHFIGRKATCCSVVAAKVGSCSEDCKFCSQSARYQTNTKGLEILESQRVHDAAAEAAQSGACCFGIVNSGRGPSDDEVEHWGQAVTRIAESIDIKPCASLGTLTTEQARTLKSKGLRRYHHNLETSRNHFPSITTTHTYDDRIETCRNVKAAGLELCSGVLFGLGETWEDRVDLAFDLRDLAPTSVPINFLVPIEGTPLAGTKQMTPMDCLKAIALYRFVLPKQEIRIAGGREACLGDLQSWVFAAGADSIMIGNYLTTCGRAPDADRRMLQDLGFELVHDVTSSTRPSSTSTADSPPHAAS